MNPILLVGIFAYIIVSYDAMEKDSFGAYFVEVTRYNESSSTNNHSEIDFNKHFHRCSIKAACNYIGICTKSQNVKWYSKEIDVPFNKNWFRVWKKVISTGHGRSITLILNSKCILLKFTCCRQALKVFLAVNTTFSSEISINLIRVTCIITRLD